MRSDSCSAFRGGSCTLTAKTMPGDVLRCLGKCARWFPEVVPGAASGIAYRKCSAAAPAVLERQFRTWRDAIKVAPGQVARTPVTVSGIYCGYTESEHRARLTVACRAYRVCAPRQGGGEELRCAPSVHPERPVLSAAEPSSSLSALTPFDLLSIALLEMLELLGERDRDQEGFRSVPATCL